MRALEWLDGAEQVSLPWAGEEWGADALRRWQAQAGYQAPADPTQGEGSPVIRDLEAFMKQQGSDAGLRAAIGAPPRGEKRKAPAKPAGRKGRRG